MPRQPCSPATDEMFTIEPPPAARDRGIAARMPRNAPTRFTSSTRRERLERLVLQRVEWMIPALLTSTVSGPNAASAARPRGPAGSSVDVEVDVARGVAELGGERLARLVEDVADTTRAALAHERPRLRGALAARAAGDERDAAHGFLPALPVDQPPSTTKSAPVM